MHDLLLKLSFSEYKREKRHATNTRRGAQSGPSKRNELVGNLEGEPIGEPEGEPVGR